MIERQEILRYVLGNMICDNSKQVDISKVVVANGGLAEHNLANIIAANCGDVSRSNIVHKISEYNNSPWGIPESDGVDIIGCVERCIAESKRAHNYDYPEALMIVSF